MAEEGPRGHPTAIHTSSRAKLHHGFCLRRAGDGFEAGLFRQMFIDAGLLNDDGSPGPPVIEMQGRAEATGVKDPLHIGINVMLTSCQRWESVMVIVQVSGQISGCASLICDPMPLLGAGITLTCCPACLPMAWLMQHTFICPRLFCSCVLFLHAPSSLLAPQHVAQGIGHYAQDLAMLFDEINVSTSMHRIAKLSRKYEVSILLLVWPNTVRLCMPSLHGVMKRMLLTTTPAAACVIRASHGRRTRSTCCR